MVECISKPSDVIGELLIPCRLCGCHNVDVEKCIKCEGTFAELFNIAYMLGNKLSPDLMYFTKQKLELQCNESKEIEHMYLLCLKTNWFTSLIY